MTSLSTNQCVVIAKFLRPHGVEGKIKLESYTQPTQAIQAYTLWLDSNLNRIAVHDVQPAGDIFIVTLTDVNNRQRASEITNTLVYTPKEQLPVLNDSEYYWHQLQGLRVINHLKQDLGIVSYLTEGPQYDLLVVSDAKQNDILIPYEKSVVTRVDIASGLIHVSWEHPDDL